MPYKIIAILITLATVINSANAVAKSSDKSLISVTGEATLYTTPDEANVSMTVEVRDKELKQAQRRNDDITSKILDLAITKLRIDKKHVKTNYINIRPVYEYKNCGKTRCKTPEFSYFETRKGISIKLTDINLLQELLDKAITKGVTRIDSVSFASSETESLKEQAQIEAAKNAYKKANNIAKALGVSLGYPHRVNATGSSRIPYQRSGIMQTASIRRSETTDTISVGQITVKSSVNIDFEIAK